MCEEGTCKRAASLRALSARAVSASRCTSDAQNAVLLQHAFKTAPKTPPGAVPADILRTAPSTPMVIFLFIARSYLVLTPVIFF